MQQDQHIPTKAEKPLKFKYLYKVEIDLFLQLSLPLSSPSLLPLISYSFNLISSSSFVFPLCLLRYLLPSFLLLWLHIGITQKNGGMRVKRMETQTHKAWKKDEGREEPKHSHPFLIKAAVAQKLCGAACQSRKSRQPHLPLQIYLQLGILAVSHHTQYGRFHHHLIRQWADSHLHFAAVALLEPNPLGTEVWKCQQFQRINNLLMQGVDA